MKCLTQVTVQVAKKRGCDGLVSLIGEVKAPEIWIEVFKTNNGFKILEDHGIEICQSCLKSDDFENLDLIT